MPSIVELESTLTSRYQTTVPETVRRALKLGKHDKIHYSIESDGRVLITRADAAQDNDPVLEGFLTFLAKDIAAHPKHVLALDSTLVSDVQALIGALDVDLDAPLSPENE